MFKHKKILALVLCMCMVFACAACTGKDTSSDKEIPSSSTQGETSDTDSSGDTTSSKDGASSENQSSTDSSGDTSSEDTSSKVSSDNGSTVTSSNPSSTPSTPNQSTATSSDTSSNNSSSGSQTGSKEENLEFQNLTNTLAKIKNGEELNIAFIGGSITDGTGSTNSKQKGWPRLVCNWLEEEYGVKVNENRKSIGGTGSYLGAMRFSTEVVAKESDIPDLLFIEFAVNDSYLEYTYDQCVKYTESIVREAYEVNPNVEIIFVLSFDKGLATSDFETLRAHRAVAEKYGLAAIKIGEDFYKIVSEKGGSVSDYLDDSVHPNDAGYEIYAQIITGKLAELINAAEKEHAQSGSADYLCTAKKLPKTAMSNYFKNPTLVYAKAIDRSASTGWKYVSKMFSWVATSRFPGYVTASTQNSKLVFEFEGSEFGMVYHMRQDMGTVSISIDGKQIANISGYLSYSNPREAVIAENLEYGKHTVEILLKNNSNFEIGALLYS